MKPSLLMFCLAVQTALITGESTAPNPAPVAASSGDTQTPIPGVAAMPPAAIPSAPKPQDRSSRAWLGVKLSKPDSTTTAHLPGLPMGMGFFVRQTDPDGPAEQAGIQANDILWKMGDQWLANESQLAALLRLSSPGDEVLFSGFRAGKPTEFRVKLGQAPAHSRGIPPEMLDSAVLPGECGGPWRVINVNEKLATFSTLEGNVEVRKLDDGYAVKIISPNQVVIYDGPLPGDGAQPPYPEPWPRRVHALKRGLDHALAGNLPMRQPRPRVIAPPAQKLQPGASPQSPTQ